MPVRHDWTISQQIRAYVAAMQEKAIKTKGSITQGSEIAEWIEWATKKAEIINPLNKVVDS